MNHLRLIYLGCVGTFLCAAFINCSSQSIDEVKSLHHVRARDLLEKQQFREALIEYQALVKLDPRDDEAQYQLALLHLKLGKAADVDLAHQALLKVIKLKPSRSDANLDLARLYLLAEQPARARLHADVVLGVEPMHPDGLVIRGQSLVREGSVQEGMAEFRRAIEADPHRMSGYLELARVHANQHNFSAALSVLRDALQVDSRSAETRMALGDVLAAEGHVSEAAEEYRRGLDVEPNGGALYMRLAILSQKQKRLGEAESVYRRWIDVLPNDAQAHVALAQFYRSTGRAKEALTAYQRARQVDPSSGVAREALITFYLETNRLKEAGLEIDALLRQNPSDTGGRILQARLKLDQGEAEEALSLLQEVARHKPRSATVHQYLGIVWARMGNLSQAIAALKEARTLAPESSDIRTNLAQVYLSQGSWYLAIKEGEEAVRFNPRNVAALRSLGDAHLLAGDTKRAQELVRGMAEALPHDPLVHQRLGVIARMQHRPAEALAHFEQAIAEDPQLIEALDQIGAILLSQGKAQQARERVGRQIAMFPSDPRLHNLLGQLWVLSHNFPEAEAVFKKAMSLNDALLATYANLGELYARQGKVEQAIRQFEAILAKNPQHVPTLMILGILHEQQENFPRAMASYEEALRLNPKFAPAANNLAWLLIERGGDKDRALFYAETAREVWPHDPHIADTLGWIYYHKQMFQKSVNLLQEVVDRFPDQPLIHFHYGMAQYANGNNVEARNSLNKFLTLSPADPHAFKVKEVLAALS